MADQKTDNLPPNVKSRLFNEELYRLTPSVLDLYDVFNDERGIKFAKLVHKIFVKDIPLKDFPDEIEKELEVERPVAAGIAYDYSRRVFADLGDYFLSVTHLLEKWRQKRSLPLKKRDDDLIKWDSRKFPDDAMAKDFKVEAEDEVTDKASEKEEPVEEGQDNVVNLRQTVVNQEEKDSKRPAGNVKNINPDKSRLAAKKKLSGGIGRFLNSKQEQYLSILEALRINPRVGELLVSGNALIMQGHDNLQRPSVRNWLRDYEMVMGAKNHTAKERTDYLVNSPNGKNLSEQERIQVGLILKSYDEEEKLRFNKDWTFVFSKKDIQQPERRPEVKSAPKKEIVKKKVEKVDLRPKERADSAGFDLFNKQKEKVISRVSRPANLRKRVRNNDLTNLEKKELGIGVNPIAEQLDMEERKISKQGTADDLTSIAASAKQGEIRSVSTEMDPENPILKEAASVQGIPSPHGFFEG